MKTFRSYSSEETKQFGHDFACMLVRKPGKKALVIALRGDLGAGKTTFTQGFFRGLGIKKNPISPTFVIMRRYKIPTNRKSLITNRFRNAYHFDAYRLKREEDAEVLEFGKILSDPKNIVLVEWPEKIRGVFPSETLRLDFIHGKKEHERIIKYEIRYSAR